MIATRISSVWDTKVSHSAARPTHFVCADVTIGNKRHIRYKLRHTLCAHERHGACVTMHVLRNTNSWIDTPWLAVVTWANQEVPLVLSISNFHCRTHNSAAHNCTTLPHEYTSHRTPNFSYKHVAMLAVPLPAKKKPFTFQVSRQKCFVHEIGEACSTYEVEERFIRGFGAETWGKETTWETQA